LCVNINLILYYNLEDYLITLLFLISGDWGLGIGDWGLVSYNSASKYNIDHQKISFNLILIKLINIIEKL